MATLKIKIPHLIENLDNLSTFMSGKGCEWSLVVKILGTHRETLTELLKSPSIRRIHSLAVSQWQTLKVIKDIDESIVTMFIKPPVMSNVTNIIRYADISFNTSLTTIQALNKEAVRQNKIHRIFVMIEMGELREGIRREGLIAFYKSIFRLSNIEVIGLGTNLGCMLGIKPTYDKLIQLVLYQQLLEAMFKRNLPFVSGGSSITLPLLKKDKIPRGVNHFRIGEAAFLGTSPLYNKRFNELHTDTFTFDANIIELYKKSGHSDDIISDAAIGHSVIADPGNEQNQISLEEPSFRAVVDFGMLNVDAQNLKPFSKSVSFFGNSSDMTVYDLGENPKLYKTGDQLSFKPNYMAVAKLMTDRFINKELII